MVTAQPRFGRIGKSYILRRPEAPTETGQLVSVLHVGRVTKSTLSFSAAKPGPVGDDAMPPIFLLFPRVRLPQ